MGKKLDAIIDKCKVKAYIIEKKQAVELTIDVEKNPRQKVWLGTKEGDIYKIPNMDITYKIKSIEDFSEDTGSTPTSTPTSIKSRVFWVFQNQTYEDESKHGYIFAGFYGPPARERVKEVRCGHIIIHSYRAEVVAVSVAKDSPYPWTRQDGEYGRRVDCEYYYLRRTISTSARSSKNAALCAGAMYQPFHSNGTGNQGYLYDMTSKLRDYYISEIIKYNPDILNKIPELRKYTVL